MPLIGDGETERRLLVRSDSLSRLTPAGVNALRGYGVGTILDLRESEILSIYPHPLARSGKVRYVHVPLLPEDFPLPLPLDAYDAALDAAQPRMRAIVAAIVEEPTVTVFHCHSGTGRTGILSLIFLSLAGVERAALVDDYLESHRRESAPLSTDAAAVPQRLIHRIEQHGGAAAYLASAGIAGSEIEVLRNRLVGTR